MKQWEERCYSEGVPDEAPNKLLFSGRVPSYKAIAICLLNNDLYLKKLGLNAPKQDTSGLIRQLKKMQEKTDQLDLF